MNKLIDIIGLAPSEMPRLTLHQQIINERIRVREALKFFTAMQARGRKAKSVIAKNFTKKTKKTKSSSIKSLRAMLANGSVTEELLMKLIKAKGEKLNET